MSRSESLLTHSEWEKWGEVPHDYVLLREDAVVGEQELIEFWRARLAHFKFPKAVHFGPLPKPRRARSARTYCASNRAQ